MTNKLQFMKKHICFIDSIHDHINSKAVLKFQKKKITLENKFPPPDIDSDEICIKEESNDSRLRKLTIRSEKRFLIEDTYKNGAFINLDLKDPQLSCYTHFVKSASAGLRQKCDFAFIYKYGESVHVLISELKSSRGGINKRCQGQFDNSKVFLDYLKNLMRTVENISPSIIFYFYKVIFMPKQNSAIALPETTTPVDGAPPVRLKTSGYNVYELETDEAGNAEINIKSIVSAIPVDSIKLRRMKSKKISTNNIGLANRLQQLKKFKQYS